MHFNLGVKAIPDTRRHILVKIKLKKAGKTAETSEDQGKSKAACIRDTSTLAA